MGVILGSDLEQALNLRDWDTPNTIVPVVVRHHVNVTPIATLIARNKARIRMDELIGDVKWFFPLAAFVCKAVKLVYVMSVPSMDLLPARRARENLHG